MRDALELLQALERITDRIAGGKDLDETLEAIANTLEETLHASRCSILLKSGADELRMRAARGVPDGVMAATRVRVGEGIAGEVARSGRARLMRNLERRRGEPGEGYASDSAICAPMSLRGEVLGILNVNDKRPPGSAGCEDFDEQDLLLAMVLANQGAIAVDAARSLETAREHERLKRAFASLEERMDFLEDQASALEVIGQVTDLIVSMGTVDEVLGEIVRNTAWLLNARRGSVMLIEPDGELLRMHAAVGISEDVIREARARLGQGIAGRVAETGEAILIEDIEDYDGGGGADDGVDRSDQYQSRSAICVPLKIKGDVLGVLNINDHEERHSFDKRDFLIAQLIANQAAVAISNSRLVTESVRAAEARRALEVAREIQRSFVPPEPRVPGLRVAGKSISCDETGGDYVDYAAHTDPEGRATGELFVAVGDVSGHGVGSALIMATSRAFLRALLSQSDDLSEIFERLNRLVMNDVRRGQFMTLFAGMFDPRRGRLVYTSAGHDPPFLQRARDGVIRELEATGPPLGVVTEAEYPTAEVALETGDLLLLTTDGVWEATDAAGESFGRERVAQLIGAAGDLAPDRLIEAIELQVRAFRGVADLRDDLSLVAVRVESRGIPARPGAERG